MELIADPDTVQSVEFDYVHALTTEAELDAEVKAEQIGAILVLAGNVDVEFARRDLAGQGDGVLKLVVASRERTLKIGVVRACLLANIEATSKKPDESKLDDDVGKGSILYIGRRKIKMGQTQARFRCFDYD